MNKGRWLWLIAALILIACIQYFRPVPMVAPAMQLPTPPHTEPVNLTWPSAGQASLGALGYGLLASHGQQQPAPIGSTAKIITALAVLKRKPIAAGSQGPVITLTQSDVDSFNSYYGQDGSVTQVSAGEKITERQALESLMLPSSNNMADSLAVWAFGSKDAYLKYANQMVSSLGLNHTSVGDTNGFSDSTTSTADDMVKLGLAAIQNPTIAKVVGETAAQIPVGGVIKNTNFLLGSYGIVGIKTGHTDKAGGNYIFASKQNVQGRQVTLVGAILNQPDITSAIQASPALITTGDTGFEQKTVIHKGEVLGTYKAPWGAKTQLVSPKDVNLLMWKGAETKISGYGDIIGSSRLGMQSGQVTVSNARQSEVIKPVLSGRFSPPSIFWRLIR